MKPQELREEVSIELEALEATVYELGALHHDVAGREPTTREKTAAAAFLAQFYSGIENILKRISHYHGIPLPRGETWHVDLFQRFTAPPYGGLPVFFARAWLRIWPLTGALGTSSCTAIVFSWIGTELLRPSQVCKMCFHASGPDLQPIWQG
jgi:hypothetical protein